MKILVSPSVLNADFGKLAEECVSLEKSGADWIHCDVMDGEFVPNLSFGLPVVEAIDKAVTIPLDVHLMIRHPLRYVSRFAAVGADWITFHLESDDDVASTCRAIKDCGCKVGISLKPATDVEQLLPYASLFDMILIMSVEPGFGGQKFIANSTEKIAKARRHYPDKLIQVDGGINAENAQTVVNSGADVLVVGSALLHCADRKAMISTLKALKRK